MTGEGVIIRDVRSSISDKRRWKSVIYVCMYICIHTLCAWTYAHMNSGVSKCMCIYMSSCACHHSISISLTTISHTTITLFKTYRRLWGYVCVYIYVYISLDLIMIGKNNDYRPQSPQATILLLVT